MELVLTIFFHFRLSSKRKTFEEGNSNSSSSNIFGTKKLKRKSFETEEHRIDENKSSNVTERSFNLDLFTEKEIVFEKTISSSTQIPNPPVSQLERSRSVVLGDPKKIKVIVKIGEHTLLVPFRIDEKVKILFKSADAITI